MHTSVDTWLREIVTREKLWDRRVLEVGSLNVNGSPRGLFTGEYFGIDKQPGLGVNQVMDANHLELEDQDYDVVLCVEMLEHDPRPWLSFAEMYRVLEPGGHLLVTTRGPEFPLHDYGGDYFRYTAMALESLAVGVGFLVQETKDDPEAPGTFMYSRRAA